MINLCVPPPCNGVSLNNTLWYSVMTLSRESSIRGLHGFFPAFLLGLCLNVCAVGSSPLGGCWLTCSWNNSNTDCGKQLTALTRRLGQTALKQEQRTLAGPGVHPWVAQQLSDTSYSSQFQGRLPFYATAQFSLKPHRNHLSPKVSINKSDTALKSSH